MKKEKSKIHQLNDFLLNHGQNVLNEIQHDDYLKNRNNYLNFGNAIGSDINRNSFYTKDENGKIKAIHFLFTFPASILNELNQDNNEFCIKSEIIDIFQDFDELTELTIFGSALENDISSLFRNSNKIEYLNLSGNIIRNFSFLSNLSNLTYLNLSDTYLEDLKSFKNLCHLKHLDISCNSLKNIDEISNFNELESITIRKVEPGNIEEDEIIEIADFSSLYVLKNLKVVYIANTNIDSLKYFNDKPNLEFLWLPKNNISGLANIVNCPKLKYLNLNGNLITSIANLILPKIEELNLMSNEIMDISGLQNLMSLKKLELQNNEVEDISQLKGLVNLEELSLDNNKIDSIDFATIENFKNLVRFCTTNNPIVNIPSEIVNDKFSSLPGIRAFLTDEVISGSEKNNEVKVLLFGNGNVGKTQIARRLANKPYDKKYHSTQKVDIFLGKIPDIQNNETLNLHIWDFAGQDIYHATHRVFMENKAIFIIVWDHKTFVNPIHKWNGNQYANYSLNYWLEYIHYHSPGSPILIVQNKIDEDGARGPDIPEFKIMDLVEKYGNKIGFAKVSAETDDGLDILKEKILNIFRTQNINDNEQKYDFDSPILEEFKRTVETPLVISWKKVIEKIRQHQEKNVKNISLAEYHDLCSNVEEENNFTLSDKDVLLKFLSYTSILYYNPAYFKENIFLDQQWFIDELYKLFDRTKDYYKVLSGEKHIQQRAILTPSLIKEIWGNSKDQEKEIKLYLDYMIKAEIILKLDEKNSSSFIDLQKDIFFVPHFLPDKNNHIEEFKQRFDLIQREEISYSFIPPVLIIKLMMNYMKYSNSSSVRDKWQNGIIIANGEELCCVTVDYSGAKWIIEYNEHSKKLANKINEEIQIIDSKNNVKSHREHEKIVYGLEKYILDVIDDNTLDIKMREMKKVISMENDINKVNELLREFIFSSNIADNILEMYNVDLISKGDKYIYNKNLLLIVNNLDMSTKIKIDQSAKASKGGVAVSGPVTTMDSRGSKNNFFKKHIWKALFFIVLSGGGFWYFSPKTLTGKVFLNSKELNNISVRKIGLSDYSNLGTQELNTGSNGTFVFHRFPRTAKNIQFLLTFNDGTVIETEQFPVLDTEDGNFKVNDIWIEKTENFQSRTKNSQNKPINKNITINNQNITISGSTINGDVNTEINNTNSN